MRIKLSIPLLEVEQIVEISRLAYGHGSDSLLSRPYLDIDKITSQFIPPEKGRAAYHLVFLNGTDHTVHIDSKYNVHVFDMDDLVITRNQSKIFQYLLEQNIIDL